MLLRFATKGLFVAVLAVTVSANAEQLSYGWKKGQTISYQMEIFVDTDDEEIKHKGIFHYNVLSLNGAQATIGYRGGLAESRTPKTSSDGRSAFPAFPSFPRSFSRPDFRGFGRSTNKITITDQGQVLALEGDSQLPYLLGHASLIPFEPLAGSDGKQWTSNSGVSITKKNDGDMHPFNRFGPLGAFASNDHESSQAASELTSFKIQGVDGDVVSVKKSYRLATPETADNPSYQMSGEGIWKFSKKENLPQACEMKIDLTVKVKNTITKIPISIKYELLTAEELARIEAENKKRLEEAALAAAETKRIAETPLNEMEMRDALGALASGDLPKIQMTLQKLALKSLNDPSPEIVRAIEPHLTSSNRGVAMQAEIAMGKWSPEYATRKKLEKDYQGPSPIESTGLIIESTTPLYVGQIVQARRANRGSYWYAATVKELLPTGQVKLNFLSFGRSHDHDVETAARNDIQLAPASLAQPSRPASLATSKSSSGQTRTWSDASGKFKIDAVFVSATEGKVNLIRADGKSITIDREKLCKADRDHIETIERLKQEQEENPFKVN